MSGEKPAPTAAEVAAARTWFEGAALESFADVGFPETARHVRTLLAALDAAEARATAAEALAKLPPDYCYSCGGTGGHWEACHGTTPLIALSVSLRTAERDRDEARAALPPGAIVVSDTEETRERIARKLNATHREFAQTPNSLCYDCDCPDQDDNAPPPFDEMCDGCKSSQLEEASAALAALREPRP